MHVPGETRSIRGPRRAATCTVARGCVHHSRATSLAGLRLSASCSKCSRAFDILKSMVPDKLSIQPIPLTNSGVTGYRLIQQVGGGGFSTCVLRESKIKGKELIVHYQSVSGCQYRGSSGCRMQGCRSNAQNHPGRAQGTRQGNACPRCPQTQQCSRVYERSRCGVRNRFAICPSDLHAPRVRDRWRSL